MMKVISKFGISDFYCCLTPKFLESRIDDFGRNDIKKYLEEYFGIAIQIKVVAFEF